ncbi:MAG: hypothetical protein FD127_1751 [Acidimicrobiaceae bacterium]|nr:MAG: hypothetical protein FD127_1751 [Acidimicrobiaceae bacterium]
MPLVFSREIAHVCNGPDGPVIVAPTLLFTASGIIAITGNPAPPLHPQNDSGSGDSTMKRSRLVVDPLPGKRIGSLRGEGGTSPRITSSVAPDRHGEVAWLSHLPKPVVARFGRSTPMAWNGPVIQSSMWLRADAP